MKGYFIPIPEDKLYLLPGAVVCPIHIVRQRTINEDGLEGTKHRPCHDLTFCRPYHKEVLANARHINRELPQLPYGFAFLRLMNFTVAVRWKNPDKKIFLQKFDVDGAYKCIHLNIESALLTIVTLDGTTYISTWVPFGAKSAGHYWGIVS